MKIGVSCYPTYGGSGIVAAELSCALAARGHEVHVISYARPHRLSWPATAASTSAGGSLHFHKVDVRGYPLFEYPPYSLALATKMVEVARRHQLELMHVHYAVPNAVSAVLARQMLAPQPIAVVTTLHGTDVTLVGKDPSYLETTRFGVVQSDAVTAVSSSLRATTLEQLSVDCDVEVVPNFVDAAQFAGQASPGARRWATGDEPVFVHVSNFRPVKRALQVLRIFEAVRARRPCKLLLVGEGPDHAKVAERAGELGLGEDVVLLGELPAVEEALVGATAFLLPSSSESFGLAALEAMAAGVPVVGSRVGGMPEVVVDG
ncbi:MAG: N-acetyl-alpha-D-glucosaminyl L-malate synthase BshA, partial [Acidobacteriota bacterium]